MTLIWAEGFTGDKALAPLWRRYTLAEARSNSNTLTPNLLGQATIEAREAKLIYDAAATEVEDALAQAAGAGHLRTHALVIGVGQYADAGIRALTTSVYGAWAFADWMLTRFHHLDRPLGSLELLLSPTTEMGDWQPSSAAAAQLGLANGATAESLAVEEATFANIQAAFQRWLKRAGTHANNAAFCYFAGHGLWKGVPFLLPKDAQLASSTKGFDNLIDIQQTQQNMFNTQPSVQCFFIDACQELTSTLLQNIADNPGKPLHSPTTGGIVAERTAYRYTGSRAGQRAYGPADQAPFFTQELLACLERRGAAFANRGNTWSVTADSLRTALTAASGWRSEMEQRNDIRFSTSADSTGIDPMVELCHIQGNLEIFVKIGCLPPDMIGQGKLYVGLDGQPHFRAKPLATEWYTTVTQGTCLAGIDFDPGTPFASISKSFTPTPPFYPVSLEIHQ